MDEHDSRDRQACIRAAGGLLERGGGGDLRIAVVHRDRYEDRDGSRGDWVLPKGKSRPGESFEETALREVEEETGCRGIIVGPCFPCEYVAGGRPKLVMFFRMECAREGELVDLSEVQEARWLTPGEALERLTYESERDVVRRAYPSAVSGPR